MKLRRRQFLHFAAGALTLGVARAEGKTYVMKVSGPDHQRCTAPLYEEFCRRGRTGFGWPH